MQSLIPVINAKEAFPLCELFERAHCEMINSVAVDGLRRRQIGAMLHFAIHHAHINSFIVRSRIRADLSGLILRLLLQTKAPRALWREGTCNCWLFILGESNRTSFVRMIPREDIVAGYCCDRSLIYHVEIDSFKYIVVVCACMYPCVFPISFNCT